jgi:hypothetical protein
MITISDNAPEEEGGEEEELAFDFWSDDGARRFNEALDEGSAYVRASGHHSNDLEDCLEEEEREYNDPELCDPGEETLPPGEMELIFENSYIM